MAWRYQRKREGLLGIRDQTFRVAEDGTLDPQPPEAWNDYLAGSGLFVHPELAPERATEIAPLPSAVEPTPVTVSAELDALKASFRALEADRDTWQGLAQESQLELAALRAEVARLRAGEPLLRVVPEIVTAIDQHVAKTATPAEADAPPDALPEAPAKGKPIKKTPETPAVAAG